MSFESIVIIDGFERKLHHCSYSVSRSIDNVTGKPTSDAIGGIISLVVEGKKESIFWKLAIHPYKLCNGRVKLIDPSDFDGNFMIVDFEDGAVVEYSASIYADTNSTLRENVMISCRKLTVDGVVFEKQWAD